MAFPRCIHIVSFQFPLPSDYGGVVDIYYKLKSLKEAGVKIILHSFVYDRGFDESIYDVADEVFLYPRRRGLLPNISLNPYIVTSRNNKSILDRLLADDYPVLLEGLHTCSVLPELKKAGKIVGVRTHNVEHEYYRELARACGNPLKKAFYFTESLRLRNFEKVLSHADMIFAVSESDEAYFRGKYPECDVKCVYPFFNDSVIAADSVSGNIDVLYHGNLQVEENVRALNYILDEVKPRLSDDVNMVVAGLKPASALKHKILRSGATLVESPSMEDMDRMIGTARVNLLVSFQNTGVKLKLLHALATGTGQCIVNSALLSDKRFEEFCTVGDTPEKLAEEIERALANPVPEEIKKKQREKFLRCFSNISGVETILDSFRKHIR